MSKIFSVVLVIAFVCLGLVGCSEKDVPFVSDGDEIADYIEQEELATDLFRTEGLIGSTPYQSVIDDATYVDSVLSHTRTVTVLIGDTSVDYDGLGWLFEAVANVNDDFQIRTLRISGTDTTSFDHLRTINRVGFFLKIGSDNQPYLGWLLRGFGGLSHDFPPVEVLVQPESEPSFPGDIALYNQRPRTGSPSGLREFVFVNLSDITEIENGSDLVVETNIRNSSIPIRYYQHISAATDAGFFTRPMRQVTRNQYVDTLDMTMTNPRLYDIVMLQSFVDTSFSFSKAWVFPCKVLE